MTAHVKLIHLFQNARGVGVHSVTVSVDGTAYDLPLPLQIVSGSVAIMPEVEADETSTSVVVRMNRWKVVHLDAGKQLTLRLRDMATATRVARDFETDPGVSWRSDPADIDSWCVAWLDAENARASGGDR